MSIKSKLFRGGSISMKLFVIGFLLFVFFPVSFLVQGLIEERSERQVETVAEVSSKWGQGQTITGPVLTVPYTNYYGGYTKYAYFLPEDLSISGDVSSELRSRGIYDVPLYEGNLKFQGSFKAPDFSDLGVSYNEVLWDQATVSVGIPDMRGVTEQLAVVWNDSSIDLEPGVKSSFFTSGVSSAVPVSDSGSQSYDFSFDLKLRGSEELYFIPLGKDTSVSITSDWISPSFDGAFLPTEHEITDAGFTASWNVLDLNTNIPRKWSNETNYYLDSVGEAFGVELYLPVDVYQKAERSAKYAMAVIGLVFLVLFLVEVVAKSRIHPMQYILIGLALCVFYTLLLSLSEYVRFGYAYLIASIAIVGMVGMFSRSVMKSRRLGLMNGGIVAILYAFIYVLLQMSDFTLLVGSVALFVILASVMYVTRKIDWYGGGEVEA
jgi:inner membrane protein